MANSSGVVYEHENARPGLSPEIPLSGHRTQVYNQAISETVDARFPALTHSQRAMTKLCVECHRESPSFEEILECLEFTLHVTQDLLKRPDEAEIVLKAHRFPQFAEDVVRENCKGGWKKIRQETSCLH